MDNEITTNTAVVNNETTDVVENSENVEETTEQVVKEDGQISGQDFIPGPDDIVIEEDFDIKLDIKPISADPVLKTPGSDGVQTAPENNEPVNLGTEQSGNITF